MVRGALTILRSSMADLEFTENQQRAIDARGKNLVVVAGAGAGKTRVLVARYLALLARGIPLASIVAITFTEKAAREMRDRVRRAIESRAANSEEWRAHLRTIDAARISTIHSLCAALLRANPAEAEVDPRFQVIEEADAAIWQDEAIDAAFAQANEQGGAALVPLVAYDARTVREALTKLFARGADVDDAFARVPENADALIAEWQTRWERAQSDARTRLVNRAAWRDAANWVRANSASDAKDKLEIVRATFAAYLDQSDVELDALRIISGTSIGNIGSKKNWDDLAAAKQNIFALRNLAQDYIKNFDGAIGDDDRRAATLVFQWRALWTLARTRYAERKTAERVLDFNDLEARTRALLRDHRDVRDRYRAEFACLLVDEYQDTNAAQRDIIYALASPDEADRLFIVADGKQSIYGFRGADVSVFTQTRRDMATCWGDDAIIPLAESFRAHAHLVGAINHIFADVFTVEGERAAYEIAYEPMRAVRPSLAREPSVEILQIAEKDAAMRREWQAQEIAARARELVDGKFQVWDKDNKIYRDARWSDVALLFRVSTHFRIFEEAFKAANVPYITLAGKGYYDRAEVRDLINLLRALDNPFDDLATAIVLRSPLFALSDETLYRLRRAGAHFFDALAAIPADISGDERARVEFAHRVFTELGERVGRVPILDLLTRALDATDYLATVTSLDDGERRRGNVEKLLALARRTGLARLSEFNAYLQDLTAQEVREGEAVIEAGNAVQLMTIHRAKGLEFPIVIIPDASRALGEKSETLLADREQGVAVSVRDARGKRVEPVGIKLLKQESARRADAEEKRLLYVAATRAQDFLIVCGDADPQDGSYLAQILDALGGRTQFDWGTVAIREPVTLFAATAPTAPRETRSQPRDASTEFPRLAKRLDPPTVRALESFVPTGLETLVRDRAEFARRVIEGAPNRVTPISHKSAPGFVIGEMAHRAIRRWRLPATTPNLDAILHRYAEENGLSDQDEIVKAKQEATQLLKRFEASELCREMAEATRRHEVPFVVEWQGRMIHGSIDALCQSRGGEWWIVDFKTDNLEKKNPRTFTLEAYGVQLALYEHAARVQFGAVRVRVHYIRASETFEFTRAELEPSLEKARAAL